MVATTITATSTLVLPLNTNSSNNSTSSSTPDHLTAAATLLNPNILVASTRNDNDTSDTYT
jgi:hypothetical protein